MSFEPKDVIRLFYHIYGRQHREPLTTVSLYLIHTDRYNKPYKPDVKEIMDKHKERILRLIETKELNSKNAFDRAYIRQLNDCDELTEHEYTTAFVDLIEENETVYKLCLQTLKDNNNFFIELLKSSWI